MEYLVGSFVTLATLLISIAWFRKQPINKVKFTYSYTQSRMHEIMRPLNILNSLINIIEKEDVMTQSKKHYDAQHVKVIISETEAYWIANNIFYTADVKNHVIIQETTREVDTMTMDEVQLKKISEIVEMLGRDNDSSSSGK